MFIFVVPYKLCVPSSEMGVKRVKLEGGIQVLSKVDTERFVAAAHLLLEPKGIFFGSCGGTEEAGANPLFIARTSCLPHVSDAAFVDSRIILCMAGVE